MGMCKGCQKVFPAQELNNGLCQECDTEQIREKIVQEKVKNLTGLILKNEKTGEVKSAPVGFSWTTLFFGGWVALLRGDILNSLWMFAFQAVLFGLINITQKQDILIPGIAIAMIIAFVYNKIYIKTLLKKGYVPFDEGSKAILKKLELDT